jgi:hypothetical protein
MNVGIKRLGLIALAAGAVLWWMQAKGYEKAKARIYAEVDACTDRIEPGVYPSNSTIKYCETTHRLSDLDDVWSRLYEFLVR